ncbi:MAG: tetratricopeptide repeat protein [bacterium]|nr:tetratricopeptide repeat protein [bacterium]
MNRRLIALVAVLTMNVVAAFAQSSENADPRALDQFIKGNAAAQQGNPYQAIYYFEDALRFDATAPFLHVALAEQYLILAEENKSADAISRAEAALESALKLDPGHIPALELKSKLLSAQGKTDKAKEVVEKLLDKDPSNQGYRAELLGLSLVTGEFDDVDSLYKLLNSSEDPDLDLTRRVVALYLMTGESGRALPYMQELASADSTDAAVTYTLATLYLQTDDTAKAIAEVNRAIQLDSADARYWYLKLVIEFEHDHYESVISLAEKARASAGEDAKTTNLEALSWLRLADSTQAMARFTRAFELDSTFYPAAGSLALLYDAMGNMAQSEKHYNTAIELSDSAAIYLNNCAYMYAVRGLKLDEAMILVDHALEKEPDNPSYLDTKGWIYYQQRKYKDALKWIKKALKKDEGSAALLEHIGDVYFAMGKTAHAQEQWEAGLAKDPNALTLKEKLGR